MLICPMYEAANVDLLKKIFEWSIVSAQDVDEFKYLLSKKFSEVSRAFRDCIILLAHIVAVDLESGWIHRRETVESPTRS